MHPSKLTRLIIPLALVGGVAANATEFNCRPGITETVYAHARYTLPPVNIHQARGELEAWADEQGIGAGGVGSYDPHTRVHTYSIIMQSKARGVTVTVGFTTASDVVTVRAENVCWEPQEDWRPLWELVNNELLRRGYQLERPPQ